MRNYENFDKCLTGLQQDIYPQPVDIGHYTWSLSALKMVPPDTNTVLDVGCGVGFMSSEFESLGVTWFGITLGEADYKEGMRLGLDGIEYGDYTFTDFYDEVFDLVYARHALEHSPFPIITLMEWRRIAKENLLLIAPAPEYWKYDGANHYSVANEEQLWWWLARAGWEIVTREYLRTSDKEFMQFYLPDQEDREAVKYPGPPVVVEYRYLCRKMEPRTT